MVKENIPTKMWRDLNAKVEEKMKGLESGWDVTSFFDEYYQQAKAKLQSTSGDLTFVPKTPAKGRGQRKTRARASKAAGGDLADQTVTEPPTTSRATRRTTRATRTDQSVLEETAVESLQPRKSNKRTRTTQQEEQDSVEKPASKKALASSEDVEETVVEVPDSEQEIPPTVVSTQVEVEDPESEETALKSPNPTVALVVSDAAKDSEGAGTEEEEQEDMPSSPRVSPRKSLIFSKPASPSENNEEEINNDASPAEDINLVVHAEESSQSSKDEGPEEEELDAEEVEEEIDAQVEEQVEIGEDEESAESEAPEEKTEKAADPVPQSESEPAQESEPTRQRRTITVAATEEISEETCSSQEEEENRNQTITVSEVSEDHVDITSSEKTEELCSSETRRLTITKSPQSNKESAGPAKVEPPVPQVRSTRTKTKAAEEVEMTEECQATRRQTRTKTRLAESSADEEPEPKRRTRTKNNSGKEPEAEPSPRRQTRSKTRPVSEEAGARRQTRSKHASGSASSEVEEAGPVRQTRTKTRQLNKAQSEASLTKNAASPRVRELAAAVMSPSKRFTPTKTVGYTGSPIRDRVKVFEQAMKESAGLKSSSDSEKESVSTPSRNYHTPGRKSSIARSLRKVSAARNVPVSTIISESSVEISGPPKKGPIIRKSPPKPKESLNNSRAPAGKIVKPGRKVAASGGRGVSPATGPRSGTGSSSLMKSRSRLELIQRAGKTTPSGKGPNLVTGVTSLLPQKPKGPTLEEIQAKKEDERKQKEQREVEARQRREEQLKSKAEEAKRQREERIRRVQDARQKQENKKEQEIARKEKENKEKLAVLKKREEMHKEAERKKKREQEEMQREEEERNAREEEHRRKEQLKREEARRKLEQQRKEEERRRVEEKKRAEARAELERIRREREELAKLKEREAARVADLDSTYNKPTDSTFNKPADSTFSKPADSTFNTTQPSERAGPQSYDITPARHELPPQPLQDEDNYGLEDLNSGTDTDDEDNPKKEVPKWAEGANLRTALLKQCYMGPNPDEIFFMQGETPDLSAMFTHQRKRFFKRTSSACWDTAPVQSTRR